jgi:NAD(P)-dependent dehydrogenase (short-subunit alcohol dehydrogenase family)
LTEDARQMSVPSRSVYPDLAGKKALVTGGAAGIGLAIASALAAQGVSVAIGDIDAAAAADAARKIGNRAIGLHLDVTRREAVLRGWAETLAGLGGCDVLVANAGVSTMRAAIDLTDE